MTYVMLEGNLEDIDEWSLARDQYSSDDGLESVHVQAMFYIKDDHHDYCMLCDLMGEQTTVYFNELNTWWRRSARAFWAPIRLGDKYI